MIRVVLPAHLRTLAKVSGEVQLEVEGPVTQRSVLDSLEARCPMLRGTIRDQVTGLSPVAEEAGLAIVVTDYEPDPRLWIDSSERKR